MLKALTEEILSQEKLFKEGGASGVARQKKLGRLTVRERLLALLDDPKEFFELGLWAAFGMYEEIGPLPCAGVVTGIGQVSGRECMVIGNDATVKAGAFFPQSVKKVLRAQNIAFECRLPILYLVDSSGVFLPLQDEIFPDMDDFGRIFRNNACLSAAGIPQFAAIMGNCIAGGGYLPVLCDKLLMTKGSGLYLAGPSLVKAAIGQIVDPEALGGAEMHAKISGTVDFLEEDDKSCLKKLKQLVALLPEDPKEPKYTPQDLENLYSIFDDKQGYDVREVIDCIVDAGSFLEYKAEYGKTLVTGYAKLDGLAIGIVANQRKQTITGEGEIEVGGVVYVDSANKAARFIMDCNQMQIPILFLQDVLGFMVGKHAEEEGIIRAGAKLVNVVSNSKVAKITLILGGSFGAGSYALCGKAYDPRFILAWPGAKYAVMGGEQASQTFQEITKGKASNLKVSYEKQMDIRYGAARGWVDAIIAPLQTRKILSKLFQVAIRAPLSPGSFHTGVLQV